MCNCDRSPRVPFATRMRKAGIRSLTNWAIGTFLAAGFALTAHLSGQTSAAQAPDSGAATAITTHSNGQPDPAAGNGRAQDAYIIGDDDVLSINVWNEKDLTGSVPVRSDGKISLPLVGEVQASGRTPVQLGEDLTVALRGFITDPQVTVIVQTINSRKFNILGQVTKPGSYVLTADTTMVDAIALAGGFRDFAKKKGVYILRMNPNGGEARIRFNYQSFIKGKNTSQNIKIKPNDTIVVP
jgi:polysaccharide export outer membrane protein